jgi:hypothetical protein
LRRDVERRLSVLRDRRLIAAIGPLATRRQLLPVRNTDSPSDVLRRERRCVNSAQPAAPAAEQIQRARHLTTRFRGEQEMMSKRQWATCAIAGALIVTAGCGSAAKKVDPAADRATIKAALLTASDLPGYKATPATTSSGSDMTPAEKRRLASCMHTSTTIFDDPEGSEQLDTPDFTKGSIDLSGTIETYPQKQQLDAIFDQVSSSHFGSCFSSELKSAFAEGANDSSMKIGSSSITPFAVKLGDRGAGYTIAISFTGPALTSKVYLDLFFVQKGRAVVTFSATNIGSRFSHSTAVSLTAKMVDRLGNQTA